MFYRFLVWLPQTLYFILLLGAVVVMPISVCRASFEFQPGRFLSELLSKCGSVADMRTEAVGSFRVCPELDLTYVDIQTEGHCLYFTLDIAQNLLCSF